MYKKINVRKVFKIFVRKFLAYVSVRTKQFFVRPSEFGQTYRTAHFRVRNVTLPHFGKNNL
jgi:hypothetical protein